MSCWIGCVVGASICFWVSGQLLRDRIGRLFDGRRWHRIVASVLTSGGWKALALLRLTPLVPFVVLNYLSAPMGVRFGAYLNGTALAIVPAVFVWAMIGASARMELLEEVGMRWLRWGLTGIGVIATLGLGIWARRSIGEHVARHA